MAHEEQVAPVVENGISRRKLIATGGAVAVAGVAVGAAGMSVVSSPEHSAAASSASVEAGGPGTGEPVMVHLKDASSGQFDVFVGERHSSFTDRAMAAQVIKAASTAE